MRGSVVLSVVGFVAMALACSGELGALGGLGSGDPLYGSGTFGSADIEVEVRAGGSQEAKSVTGVPETCMGYIAPEQPDYVLNVPSTAATLRIASCSDADTALVIRTPMGTIECVDDSEGTNPVWDGTAAASGDYEVWVATYGAGGSSAATLRVTGDAGPVCTQFEADGPPHHTLDPLASGFGRTELVVNAGGGTPANMVGTGVGTCTGYIPGDGPTTRLTLSGGGSPLNVAGCGPTDLTLLIRTPDGRLLCDDDTEDNKPVVRIAAAAAGDYDIFLGTYGQGESPTSRIVLSEEPGLLCSQVVAK